MPNSCTEGNDANNKVGMGEMKASVRGNERGSE